MRHAQQTHDDIAADPGEGQLQAVDPLHHQQAQNDDRPGDAVVGPPLRTGGDGSDVRAKQQRHDETEIGRVEEMAVLVPHQVFREDSPDGRDRVNPPIIAFQQDADAHRGQIGAERHEDLAPPNEGDEHVQQAGGPHRNAQAKRIAVEVVGRGAEDNPKGLGRGDGHAGVAELGNDQVNSTVLKTLMHLYSHIIRKSVMGESSVPRARSSFFFQPIEDLFILPGVAAADRLLDGCLRAKVLGDLPPGTGIAVFADLHVGIAQRNRQRGL